MIDITSHFDITIDTQERYREQDRKWSKSLVKAQALMYAYRSDFQKKSNDAYQYAYRHGLLSKICDHMPINGKSSHSYKSVLEIALKYKTRTDFSKGDQRHYQWARRNGMLDDVCRHMGAKWGAKWGAKS